MKLPIYLDYSATTPIDPRVAQKMSECLLVDGNFGNPASRSHVFGWKAEEAVENGFGNRSLSFSFVLLSKKGGVSLHLV